MYEAVFAAALTRMICGRVVQYLQGGKRARRASSNPRQQGGREAHPTQFQRILGLCRIIIDRMPAFTVHDIIYTTKYY